MQQMLIIEKVGLIHKMKVLSVKVKHVLSGIFRLRKYHLISYDNN